MVFQDITVTQNSQKNSLDQIGHDRNDSSIRTEKNNIHFYRASLMDRFFSFIIDYLVLSPFVSFVLFLFFQESLRYWRSQASAPEQVSLTILLAVSFVFVFSFLQAVFIYLWQATPGQYFLKLQIQFENLQSFIFWRAFLRQVGFWVSFLFLAVPWLSLLSEKNQKTFYDRLADCFVVTRKQNSEYFSFEYESKYWQSFKATLMIFVGFLGISLFWSKYQDVIHRVASFEQLEKNNFFCTDLKNVKVENRLQMAIAMNLIGQVSNACLDKEADFVLWKQVNDDVSLAYFAKSLTEKDKEIENKYLLQACDGHFLKNLKDKTADFSCQLATAFQLGQYDELYTELVRNSKNSEYGLLKDVLTYELSNELNKKDQIQARFEKLDQYDSHKLIKKYLLSEIISNSYLKEASHSLRVPASDNETTDDDVRVETKEKALKLLEDL